MAERLTDLLHHTVDDVPVPHPDTYAIAAAGRARRTRRRVGAVAAVVAAVAAVGVGGLVGGLADGDARSSQVAGQGSAEDEYAELGAWSIGDQMMIGTTPAVVDPAPHHLAQTSAGVVAQQHVDGAGSHFMLVLPDGSQRELGIPWSAPTIDGDINAPRVAWLEPGTGEGVVHVWDVLLDREVARQQVDLPGMTPEGGREIIQPVQLDGDVVYVGTDQGSTHRIGWADGHDAELPFSPVSVRNGIAVSTDDTGTWRVVNAETGTTIRVLGRHVERAQVSPDGAHLLVVRTDDDPAAVEPTRGGAPVPLPGLTGINAWTRDGHVIGQSEGGTTLRTCSTDGDCELRPLPWVGDPNPLVLVADYLMVG